MTITIKEEYKRNTKVRITKGDIIISDSVYLVLYSGKEGLSVFDLKFNSIDKFDSIKEFKDICCGIDKVISSENYSIVEN